MKQYDLKLSWDDRSYYRRAFRSLGVQWTESKGLFNRIFTFQADDATYQEIERLVVDHKLWMQNW